VRVSPKLHKYKILHCTRIDVSNCINVNKTSDLELNANKGLWFLFFDGSKSNEGAGVGCILQDPKGNKTMIACRLEFQCTNNIVEYDALIQCLRKAIDLKVKKSKPFGDSEIIVKQVRNCIHYISNHLKNYQ
jgi:hypothetical protein